MIQQFYELRGHDPQELKQRLSSLRQEVGARGGVVLDVEWAAESATLLIEVPSNDAA